MRHERVTVYTTVWDVISATAVQRYIQSARSQVTRKCDRQEAGEVGEAVGVPWTAQYCTLLHSAGKLQTSCELFRKHCVVSGVSLFSAEQLI